MPPVGTIADLDFPPVQRARLSNGVEVVFARQAAVPVVRVSLQFDAGYAADAKNALGTQSLMLSLLDEGTATRNSIQIAEEKERLGAVINAGASIDRSNVTLAAMKPLLGPSLDLMADIVKNPAFNLSEIERVRAQQLAQIANEKTQPIGLAFRTLPPILYGGVHPYGVPFTGTGDELAVRAVTRADLLAAHQRWLRPDNLTIFAVGDTTLAELTPMLEARFGTWATPAVPKGQKEFGGAIPKPTPRIVIVDRPQSPQSLILGGLVMPLQGTDHTEAFNAANEVLGNNFLSRINTDLRETKGWSYGSYGLVDQVEHNMPYLIYAPVQTDKTAESLTALRQQIGDFLSTKGVTPVELRRTLNGVIRELPGSFETGGAVLSALQGNAIYRRPDNYFETLASLYRGMSAADLDAAARKALDIDKIVWVVVGDAAKIRPGLEKLGLPVEVSKLQ